jgi:uncharacterized repeat protein (TIGR03803 family)
MSKFNWRTKACGIFLLWATAAIALPAQTFTTLHSFDNTDGNSSRVALVQGIDGDLYGTMFAGGARTMGCGGIGCGTVFKITPSGKLTTLYNFCSQRHCNDGSNPQAGLMQATDGNFYGTTYYGGGNGAGTVFKITPSGTLTTLHHFCSRSGCLDGFAPGGALVQATNGGLYGTTGAGGANNFGTFFRITPNGTLTTLHSFGTDGEGPDGGWSRTPMANSMEQRALAGPTATARSSQSPRVAW